MKLTKRIMSLVLAAVMALCLVACGGSDSGSGDGSGDAAASDHDRTVKFAQTKIISSFDTTKYLTVADCIGFLQVYDTLVLKYDGEFEPCLADSWETSEDGMSLTFHLHEGVTWSDGEPFTAADCVFTVEKVKETMPSFAFIYDSVESVEALDDLTFVMHLKAPDASLLAYLACDFACILPKHAYELYGDEYGMSVDKIVGTGPYVVTDWKTDISVTYVAREDYFRGAADIKNIQYVTVADVNSAGVALQTGEIDAFFTSMSGVQLETLEACDTVAIDYFYTGRCDTYYFNCQNGIMSDVRMRQAVAYAINREDAIQVAFNGRGKVVNYPSDIGDICTANPDFTPDIVYTQDLDKARSLVEESGNLGATVTINAYSTEPWATLAVYLKSQLDAIGLNAQINTCETSSFYESIVNCDFDICISARLDSTYDFNNAFGIYVNSANAGMGGNYGWYSNPEMDQLLADAKAAPDVEARKEIYKQIVNIYCEDCPSFPIYANENAYVHSAEIQTRNAANHLLYDYSWVD